jgi:peptide subunit release factor 1 (eRF1)
LKLKKLIKELEKIKGRHTELVSVYIPAGYNLYEMIDQLVQERSTAENIKSKSTRKNVIAALEKIIQYLRLFKQTPPNGLAIFAGNVSSFEGKEDIRLWAIEPPEKLETKIYWCDQVFVLEPLKEMLKEKDVYGLVVLDAREATIGLLRGKRIVVKKKIDSTVPSKTVKGGMCLHKATLIKLANGQEIPINKVKKGDEVLCFDFSEWKVKIGTVQNVYKRKVDKARKVFFEKDSIIASFDHLVFVKKEKVEEKAVKDLEKQDIVFVLEGNEIREAKIKNTSDTFVEASTFFYDLEVKPFENYFANSLLVHNSQGRYDRLREDAINEFLTKVGEIASNIFLEEKVVGVLIGGPGPVKERLVREDYLHYQIRNKVLCVKDVGYTDEYGLEELVKRSEDVLQQAEIFKEKKLLSEFFVKLREKENAIVGLEKTLKALEMGAVDELIIVENFEYVRKHLVCENGHRKVVIAKGNEKIRCDICGKEMNVEREEEIFDELTLKAEESGAKVHIVSDETEEGKGFKSMGGIGAVLRFKIE